MSQLRTPLLVFFATASFGGAAADFPAGSECAALGAADPVDSYQQLAEMPAGELASMAVHAITLRVDDPVEDRWDVEALPNGRTRLMYRMGRNDVTEGWNWHPEADRASADYYLYKYLPLGQRETEVAPSRIEPDPAVGSLMVRYVRRDAYYLAFDNPYEFYERNDEDLGFAVEIEAPAGDVFQLVVRSRFFMPWRAESSTYWRAIPAQPTDLWLKNRYFMGRLETLWFCSGDGRVLARLGK